MIIVIADDITGAAEIAGIAARHKLDTQLMTQLRNPLPEADVIVIATDTRSGSESEAVETMRDIAAFIASQGDKHISIFKKTDSVLRGHIMAETRVLMEVLGYDSALLLPQNPSKGRIIHKGKYYIKGVELSETDFRYDPEFPATSSDVCKRLAGARMLAVSEEPITGICIADATSSDDIRKQMGKVGATLLVGAADCFEAMITLSEDYAGDRKGFASTVGATLVVARQEETPLRGLRIRREHPPCAGDHEGRPYGGNEPSAEVPPSVGAYPCGRPSVGAPLIVVCGSTQSCSLKDEPYIRRLGAEEIGMPEEVFHGGDASEWMRQLEQSYLSKGSIVITIGQPSTGGKDYAVRLRNLMSEAAVRLVGLWPPQCIIIEGGATAYALLDRLGWQSFAIHTEIAPGVVCMSQGNTNIILKPGSYPWGEMFKKEV